MTGAAAEPLDDDDEGLTPADELDELLDQARKRKPREWEQRTLDGHLVRVREPKGAVLVRIEIGLQSSSGKIVLEAIESFIDAAFDEASAEHIRTRLDDEEDDFDYDDIGAAFQALSATWGSNKGAASRPTGSSRGSSPRSRRTTRRSTAKPR